MVAMGEVPIAVRRRRGWWSRVVAALLTVLVGGGLVVVESTGAAAATVDTNAWYVLVNRNSGKALDVYNRATNDGARITQWTRNDGTNQQWQFVDSGGGYYRLKSRNSGKVLDVSSRSTADGAAIVQWTDGNGTNQQFRLADSADGYVQLLDRNSGKAVEVQGASTADGGNVVQYADWGGTNQQWQLVRATAAAPPPRRRRPPAATVHQPGGLAGLRRRRHHPGRRHVLLLGLDHALLPGRADPALLRPGELGVRRALGARAWTSATSTTSTAGARTSRASGRRRSTTARATAPTTGSAASSSTGPTSTPPPRSTGPGPEAPPINNCYYDAGMLVDDNDTMYVAYGNSHDQRGAAVGRRLSQVRTPAGVHHAVERRHPGGRPVLQAQRQLLHLAHPAGQRPVHAEVVAARSARTRCGRCCSTCPARSPAAACRTRAGWCRRRTATGTTWPSSTPTPAGGCPRWPRSPGPPTAGRRPDRQRRAGARPTRSRTCPTPDRSSR